MISKLAISNYRSIMDTTIPMGNLTLVIGANGTGKSNLYRALRLLSECANGSVVNAIAREGGLSSIFWAGPELVRVKKGDTYVNYSTPGKAKRLRVGFSGEDFSYSISLGLPKPVPQHISMFPLDPEIKYEHLWQGDIWRPASVLVSRKGGLVETKENSVKSTIATELYPYDSIFTQCANPNLTPELLLLREQIRGWRFYDQFPSDALAASRSPQIGTRTMALAHDGRDLAAALRTIMEIGNEDTLKETIHDAFPGSSVEIVWLGSSLAIQFWQSGLNRPMSATELSDGTLRYLLWTAALLTPRPPGLMVLNEPETSLHPDLIPALGRLILKAAHNTQVWVVSHSSALIDELSNSPICTRVELEKSAGVTTIRGQGLLNKSPWKWPAGS